ncbi:APC family permease [Aestuariivirga sp.]|uniref:APC family permease n=1 Tax=Aestuariivirga sp. TaxID=2650926 RepID=UPI0035B1947C
MDSREDSIGVAGALSIGVGGIVGGGFFATFGITAAGAAGGTPIAFLIGGIIALLTAYSYIGLTIAYPGPGGTVSFITRAFGSGLFAATLNVLLILCYVAIMSVYAFALAGYTEPYLPAALRWTGTHLTASAALVILALVNFIGPGLVQKSESVFNAGKLAVLAVFIVGGLVLPGLEWSRLAPDTWASPMAIVASGMIGFLAYEGFELIANASDRIADPRRTLPIAFLGSVLIAIVIYGLAFIVGLGHLPLSELVAAKNFAISQAGASFLGPWGFGLMAVGAVLASASAITADYFGASRLPPQLASFSRLPSALNRSLHQREMRSLVIIGVLALLAVNFVPIEALSSATSGGFLLVFAAVNAAAVRLAPHTGTSRVLPSLATLLCLAALGVTVWQFLSVPATVIQAAAIGLIVVAALAIEGLTRWIDARTSRRSTSGQA